MPKVEICQLGNPVLRSIAEPITNIRDRQVQQLIDELIRSVKKANGVGIAAPQMGRSLRLLILASYPNERYPQAPQMQPTALINPTIVAHSDEIVKDWEGCLSVPGIRGLVPRYQSISVEYTDRQGDRVAQTFTDFVARIFQHEYDHLEGKVFLDRVESSLEMITDAEYFKMIKDKK